MKNQGILETLTELSIMNFRVRNELLLSVHLNFK